MVPQLDVAGLRRARNVEVGVALVFAGMFGGLWFLDVVAFIVGGLILVPCTVAIAVSAVRKSRRLSKATPELVGRWFGERVELGTPAEFAKGGDRLWMARAHPVTVWCNPGKAAFSGETTWLLEGTSTVRFTTPGLATDAHIAQVMRCLEDAGLFPVDARHVVGH